MKIEGLTQRVDAAIDAALGKRIVGTVLTVARGGRTIYRRAAGFLDREAGTPMREDAIFRLASLTKPIVATTALAMIDTGLIGLDDPVTKYFPDFKPKLANGSVPEMRIRHLITHTSGLSYDRDEIAAVGATPGMVGPVIPLEENVRRLGTLTLKFEPGTAWLYSVAIDVLGAILARLNGSPLEDTVARYVTGPLGMRDTHFFVADRTRLAAAYADGDREPVLMSDDYHEVIRDGVVAARYSPNRIFDRTAPQSGGGGMAGTAGDFMRFLDIYRTGGGPILNPETAKAAVVNQVGAIEAADRPGEGFSFIGAVVTDPARGRRPLPEGTVAWGGIYGHNWFYDPALDLTVASLSNTALEGCNGAYRDEIMRAIYG